MLADAGVVVWTGFGWDTAAGRAAGLLDDLVPDVTDAIDLLIAPLAAEIFLAETRDGAGIGVGVDFLEGRDPQL